jgi:hypothetical protein
MARSRKPKTIARVRSAITGRFVPKSRAKTNPRTTITQRIRVGRRKKR